MLLIEILTYLSERIGKSNFLHFILKLYQIPDLLRGFVKSGLWIEYLINSPSVELEFEEIKNLEK